MKTSLRRRLFTGAASLMLGATAAMALAAPAQATPGEDPESPTPPTESPTPPPATEPPAEEQESPFVTIVTCDFFVLIFPNEFDADLLFSLTPNQDTTAGEAPDFVPLLDAEPDGDGFIEIPEDADLENTEAVGAGETIGPLGPVAPGEALAHGFEAAAGLEITIEVTVEGEPVEIDEPVVSYDEAAEGLECAPAEDEDNGAGGELPVTGNTTMLIAGGAAALLALGGGLFLIARRRRVTFTA